MRGMILILVLLSFLSCSRTITRVDSQKVELTTVHWSSNDLQEISHNIVLAILSSNIDFSKNYRFGKIRNDSYDHIDTQLLKNRIQSALINSKKVTINQDKDKQYALFVGKVSSIFKKNKTTKDMFFNFNLSLIETNTKKIIWSHDIEIRKLFNKALFGW